MDASHKSPIKKAGIAKASPTGVIGRAGLRSAITGAFAERYATTWKQFEAPPLPRAASGSSSALSDFPTWKYAEVPPLPAG